jgi:hypothetical protein
VACLVLIVLLRVDHFEDGSWEVSSVSFEEKSESESLYQNESVFIADLGSGFLRGRREWLHVGKWETMAMTMDFGILGLDLDLDLGLGFDFARTDREGI